MTPIMDNQMESKTETCMETGVVYGSYKAPGTYKVGYRWSCIL